MSGAGVAGEAGGRAVSRARHRSVLDDPSQRSDHRHRNLILTLVIVAVFAVFGVVVWLAWVEGGIGPAGEPPLITAEPGPFKVRPEEPGGLTIEDPASSVAVLLGTDRPPARVERILPPLEAPRPPDPEPATPATAPRAPMAADAPAPPEPAEGQTAAGGEPTAPYVSEDLDVTDSAAPSPAPATEAGGAGVTAPESQTGTPLRAPEPPAAPARTTAGLAVLEAPTPSVGRAATPAPVVVQPTVPPAAPVVPQQPESAGAPVWRVQLAAVDSDEAARRGWDELRSRFPRLMTGLEPAIQQAEAGGRTVHRIQVGPFATTEEARDWCDRLKAERGDCFVAGPFP